MKSFDAIVIGTGGIGSAAVFQLAQRGLRVLGLDRFAGAHDHGSSYGQTRMIRQAYCEHPDYVPLVQKAFALWAELEQISRQQLYFQVGLLEVGAPDGMVVPGVLSSARQHDLDVDTLTRKELLERFSAFHVPEQSIAVFEPRAGYLLVEQCVTAHQTEALKRGAELITAEVREWTILNQSVVVRTDRESFAAGCVIVTAGAWARDLLAELGVPLTVVRKCQNWFANKDPRYTARERCPAFLFEVPQGIFYGFPQLDSRGVKVGEHSGGVAVGDLSTIDRNVDPPQRLRARTFLSQYLPGVSGPAIGHSPCLYTNSPDGHFIIDRHPAHQQISFAMGLSGHGFKFATVLGQALADLALEGATDLPVNFLKCDRFRQGGQQPSVVN